MAVAYEDKTAATQKANGSGGASASADFTTALAAGESVYSFQFVRVATGTIVSTAKLIELDSGGSPVSPAVEHDMTPVAAVGLRFEAATRQLSIYKHDNVAAAKYRSTITAGSTGAAITMAALAFSGSLSLIAMTVDTVDTDNGATTLTLTSLPESADLPTDEGVAVLVLSGNDSQANYNWPDLSGSGWTRQINVTDGAAGKHPLAIYTKTVSTNDPISVSPTFAAATYGAVGALMLLMPQEPSAVTQQFLKLRAEDNTPQGLSGIKVSVFEASGTGKFLGRHVFDAEGQAWDQTEDDGGTTKAVMMIPIPDDSTWSVDDLTLSADDTLEVVGAGTGHGIVGKAVGTVVEVIEGA